MIPKSLRAGLIRRPFTARLLLYIIFPAITAGIAIYLYLQQSLPIENGQLNLAGLHGSVTVTRDQHGIPLIKAQSDRDAFFALGFLHAQDRLWQMEYKRRLGKGELSEILGVATLESDKFMRTLGIYRAAARSFENLNSEQKLGLSAYTQGINAWLDSKPRLPIEFYYYGVTPKRWQEADSLLMIKLLALNLGANYQHELTNLMLFNHLGETAARELLGLQNRPSTAALPQQDFSALAQLGQHINAAQAMGGDGVGSNAWAVTGKLSATGMPLLASDPHMRQQIPSHFYLAKIQGDKINVAGATLPGLPMVIFGHNQHIAWGGTNLAADVQDLFVTRLRLAQTHQYEVNGQWQNLQEHDEWIHVAPAFPAFLRAPIQPLKWRVRASADGPLISDASAHDAQQALALRWTALDSDDQSYGSFFQLNYASNFTQFKEALRNHGAPALAMVYADKEDNIALLAAGKIPLRAQGDGTLPVPGWNRQSVWQRYLTQEELPQEKNPASGFIVSANQELPSVGAAHLISNNWQPNYRAKRINDLLQAKLAKQGKLSMADFVAMQNDEVDLQAADLLPFLKQLQPQTARQKDALGQLSNWNLAASQDSAAAAIYYAWAKHFMAHLVRPKLQVEALHAERLPELKQQEEVFRPAFLQAVVKKELAHWCQPGPAAQGDCNKLALLALDDALDELGRLVGGSFGDTVWGNVHQTRLPHAPFGQAQFLGRLFNRSAAVGGGRYSVNVAVSDFSKDAGYVKGLGAVYRQVIPLHDVRQAQFVLDSGQSGNILDPHYGDMLPLHSNGKLLPMHPKNADLPTLHLLPTSTRPSLSNSSSTP